MLTQSDGISGLTRTMCDAQLRHVPGHLLYCFTTRDLLVGGHG
jgi:hypothetical protein